MLISKKTIFIFFLSFVFFSCNKIIARVFFGIHNPKPETENSIINYGEKIGFNTKINYYIIDSSFVKQINRGAFPKAYIYNKNGEAIFQLDCFQTNTMDLIYFFTIKDKLDKYPDSVYHKFGPNDSVLMVTPKFDLIHKKAHLLKNSTLQIENDDYFVVYYWGKILGKTNKKSAVKMEKYLTEHLELKTSFIKVNCDFLKSWGYTRKTIKNS